MSPRHQLKGSTRGLSESERVCTAAGGQTCAYPLLHKLTPIIQLVLPGTEVPLTCLRDVPAGRVLLPLELLSFPPQYAPAMQRAFGAHVIARDSVTAAQLVTQWGISSVTPDGTLSRKGTVTGGYLGSGIGAPGGGPGGGGSRLEERLAGKLALRQAQVGLEEERPKLLIVPSTDSACQAGTTAVHQGL
jgi:hypothetical protein